MPDVIKVYNLRELTSNMLEASSDLTNQAQSAVRSNTWTRRDGIPRGARRITANQSPAYDRIAQDPSYRLFAPIPARIIRCLDYFQVRADRIAAARILSAYYIFIAVVDNALDSGEAQTAATVFEHLAKPAQTNWSGLSDVVLITRNLTEQLDETIGLTFRNQLAWLYENVCRERSAVSIEDYIEVRNVVGALTADLSYVLISPLLESEEQKLRDFMQKVGAVGCLIDSLIDLRADQRRGLVSFSPTTRDHIKLALAALRQGLAICLRHPRLAGLFADAILDDVRDRFISKRESMNGGRRQTQVIE